MQPTISLWNGLAFIVNQNWKSKIYKLGKVDKINSVLQLTRSKGKKQKEKEIWIEEDDFKSCSRLKNSRSILGRL